jgi:signal transduction histidine kinase
MGIPKDDLPKIFERFYRVKRPGRKIHGTGLGLSIAAQIITQHGGRISVESEPEKGTTFTVYLPTNPVQNGPDIAADETLEKTIAGK